MEPDDVKRQERTIHYGESHGTMAQGRSNYVEVGGDEHGERDSGPTPQR